MTEKRPTITILLAEDDEDQFLLAKDALAETGLEIDVRWVRDGEELMNYLQRRSPYHDDVVAPWPRLILLDLNMPKKDGREALSEIKADPRFRAIPVVVLTTSRNDEDIHYTYSLGGSFIRKPVRFDQIVEVLGNLAKYWLETVEPPPRNHDT
ncbi:MAG: response regulator [Deltaproteobacteria bacterium]|nr:response regulator [Deltaproteobacteria bacterium]